jgi:hypothetical protein
MNSKTLTANRKSPINGSERKREIETVKDKIGNYRKLMDKKINEISNSNLNKTLNKSNLVESSNDRSISNHSTMNKEKSNLFA